MALVNVSVSVSLILLNKYCFDKLQFKFGSLLTLIHFLVTWGVLATLARMGVFAPKAVPLREILLMSACKIGSVVFMNQNLIVNRQATPAPPVCGQGG